MPELPGSQIKISRKPDDWQHVIVNANELLRRSWAGDDPSPFKKTAAVTIALVIDSPIPDCVFPEFSEKFLKLDSNLFRRPKILRAVGGYAFSRWVLHGSCAGPDYDQRPLDVRIKASHHFTGDLLEMLTLCNSDYLPVLVGKASKYCKEKWGWS